MSAAPAESATSPWAPLHSGIFRALWIAVLVSNIGTWMQMVGAQWLLVSVPNAALLVALVQTADTLPDMVLAPVGGVFADRWDRRWIIFIVQICLAIAGLALAALTLLGRMPPALLLIFTLVIGAGSAFTTPAYQALIPDIVPRAQLPSASALGSISINLARAVGPAFAGVLIAQVGVAAVFALNAASSLLFAVVIAIRRPAISPPPVFPEPFAAAFRAGVRYVWHAPEVRSILVRAVLFLVPASVLWALLPVVADQMLQLGAGGYGLLLGALGIGAIGGALVLPRIRSRMSENALLLAASLVYAGALVALVLLQNATVILLVLLPAGMAWVAILSNLNASLQFSLPGWVRARGLAAYQVVLFGSQAAGAVLWGLIAGPVGLVWTFLIAAAALVAGAATIRRWPLMDTRGMDSSLAVYWPEPQLVLPLERDSGPVVVTNTYTIAPVNEQKFLQAMERVRGSRLRTGAVSWGLFREGESEHRFVELFAVPSWEEHLRQHGERLTGADRLYEEQADALSNPPPKTAHLIAADPTGPGAQAESDISAITDGP